MFHEQSRALWREMESKGGIACSTNGLGIVAYSRRDYQAAGSFVTAALQLRAEVADYEGVAGSLVMLAGIFAADSGGREATQDGEPALDQITGRAS